MTCRDILSPAEVYSMRHTIFEKHEEEIEMKLMLYLRDGDEKVKVET